MWQNRWILTVKVTGHGAILGSKSTGISYNITNRWILTVKVTGRGPILGSNSTETSYDIAKSMDSNRKRYRGWANFRLQK